MKVGDLVSLSAYGKKVRRTDWIHREDVGIIKEVIKSTWVTYEVMWNKSRYPGHRSYGFELTLDRRDLKFVK